MTAAFYRFWAKATGKAEATEPPEYHLLPYHSLDVAATGKWLIEKNPRFFRLVAKNCGLIEADLKSLLLFFLAIHDLGKFSICFQNLRPDLLHKLSGRSSGKKYADHHGSLGYFLWSQHLQPLLIEEQFGEISGKEQRQVERNLDIFANLACGHHGEPPPDREIDLDFSFHSLDFEGAEAWVTALLKLLTVNLGCLCDIGKPQTALLKNYSWALAGLITVADWVGSSSAHFPLQPEIIPLKAYWQTACHQAGQIIGETGLIHTPSSSKAGHRYLFPDYADSPTPLQAACDAHEIPATPGLWILEDVTGAGKTQAALGLASRIMQQGLAEGFYIALPTMATSNAMYERMAGYYRKLFENLTTPSLVLSHGSRHLSATFRDSFRDDLMEQLKENPSTEMPYCARWLADSTKKSLLANAGIGTLDQLLLGILPVKHQALRLYGMSRKILIVDEVHAYDPYMSSLLEYVLEGHASTGGSAILLSATIPTALRQRLTRAFARGLKAAPAILQKRGFPQLTHYSANLLKEQEVKTMPLVQRSVKVNLISSPPAVLAIVRKAVAEGMCVCWIRNTIDDVFNGLAYLQQNLDLPADTFLIFHSRFALYDRIKKERMLLAAFGTESGRNERRGRILIASPIVEQSLDIDFDVLISDLAPIDLLIQRAGRLHRHLRDARGNIIKPEDKDTREQRQAPVFHVVIPPEKIAADWFSACYRGAAYVYPDTAVLWRTKEVLKTKGSLNMPGDARSIIEAVFGEEALPVPEVFLQKSEAAASEKLGQRSIAGYNVLNLEEGYSAASSDKWFEEDRIPTRLGLNQDKLFLSCRKNGRWCPFYPGSFPWDLSSLNIFKGKVMDIQMDINTEEELEKLRQAGKVIYKTDKIIPLQKTQDGWEATGFAKNEKIIKIKYDETSGFRIEE